MRIAYYPLAWDLDAYPQEQYHQHARAVLRTLGHLRTLRAVRALRARKH